MEKTTKKTSFCDKLVNCIIGKDLRKCLNWEVAIENTCWWEKSKQNNTPIVSNTEVQHH